MRNSRILFTLPLLLAALPMGAATSFTATGWLTGVPLPGILCTNNSGQMYLKGNVHTLRLLANDARITGRLEAMPNVAFQPDGTRLFTGVAFSEVGIWDATTNFTASGGVWDLLYKGVTQGDGSIHYDIAGYGIGGQIDGMQLEVIANRGPGASFDPSIPYNISGTISPAPINSNLVIDNFDDGILTGWLPGGNARQPVLTESGGRFTLGCDWTGVPTTSIPSTLAWAGHDPSWAVIDRQTEEVRVDLAELNAAADGAILAYAVQEGGPNYLVLKSHNWLLLMKQSGMSFAALCGSRITTPDTGVVLSLALTGVGQNVVLTARVSNKAAPGTVHGELSYVDTPASDAVLSVQQITEVTGLNLPEFGPDPGAPYRNGQRAWLGLWQHTDGSKPAAQAMFDNFERGTYEVPRLGIQRGVRLTWPTTGMPYAIEEAPSLQGPWLPVQNPVTPGTEMLNLPANDHLKVYRSRRAP